MKCKKEGKFLKFEIDGKLAQFDLSTGECWRYYNKKWNPVKSLNKYFTNIPIENVLEELKDDNIAYAKLINKISTYYNECSNMGTFLERLRRHSNLENYFPLNIDVDIHIHNPTSYYPKDILKILSKHDIHLLTPFEDIVEYDESLCFNVLRYIDSKYGKDENDFHLVSVFVLGGYTKNIFCSFSNMVRKYNYEYKSLIDYLFWYLPRYENIMFMDAVVMLSDYLKMKTTILPEGKKFEKYPKFLKSVHDITTISYNNYKKKYKEELFEQRIDKNLEYSYGAYMVKYPESTDEIKEEGSQLVHCVSSYIDDVIDGKTSIVFLREKANPDKPLVTIEIRDGALNQVRGYYNREPNENEVEFLKKYAKNKKLIYKRYN